MKYLHLLFLLAFIGHVHAQGIVCGVLGILCPPTTVAPSSTTPQLAITTTTPASTEGTETFCFEIPGSNVDLTIDPAQLTQGQIDQIQQFLEDFLTGLPGNLTVSSNGLLGGLLDGLGGILNPTTTQAPGEGSGKLCLVLTASQIDDLEVLFNFTVSEIVPRYDRFIECLQRQVDVLTGTINAVLKEINDLVDRYRDCDDIVCNAQVLVDLQKLYLSLPEQLAQGTPNFSECFEQLPTPLDP